MKSYRLYNCKYSTHFKINDKLKSLGSSQGTTIICNSFGLGSWKRNVSSCFNPAHMEHAELKQWCPFLKIIAKYFLHVSYLWWNRVYSVMPEMKENWRMSFGNSWVPHSKLLWHQTDFHPRAHLKRSRSRRDKKGCSFQSGRENHKLRKEEKRKKISAKYLFFLSRCSTWPCQTLCLP